MTQETSGENVQLPHIPDPSVNPVLLQDVGTEDRNVEHTHSDDDTGNLNKTKRPEVNDKERDEITDEKVRRQIKQIKLQVQLRFYRALNYLSINLFVLVVYGSAVLADYALVILMEQLLQSDVQTYPLVRMWFDYAKKGLALLAIFLVLYHCLLSTRAQMKLDRILQKEGDE